MNNILSTEEYQLEIEWDLNSGIINSILSSNPIEGVANNIGGEVFFYQYDLDIPFNGEEKEVFEEGDVIYWKSPTDPKKFGILFMYGNTDYGDGTKPRTSSPGIKIGIIKDIKSISKISTGSILKLG
ncbi:Cyclophil_like domain-containing protein [Tenacibaculum sp. 190524A05c]|uniref:cyclophilin-like family protein n=1 Tax=Tenacibaculum platacis TaxID=3137852 RepID=UPI0031FA4ACD